MPFLGRIGGKALPEERGRKEDAHKIGALRERNEIKKKTAPTAEQRQQPKKKSREKKKKRKERDGWCRCGGEADGDRTGVRDPGGARCKQCNVTSGTEATSSILRLSTGSLLHADRGKTGRNGEPKHRSPLGTAVPGRKTRASGGNPNCLLKKPGHTFTKTGKKKSNRVLG